MLRAENGWIEKGPGGGAPCSDTSTRLDFPTPQGRVEQGIGLRPNEPDILGAPPILFWKGNSHELRYLIAGP